MKFPKLDLGELDAVIFDFDGVFTDNTVLVSSDGSESVRFSKSDSLGVALFKEYLAKERIDLKLLVISKERNLIVSSRTSKMQLRCFQGVDHKWNFIAHELNIEEGKYIYFGNDVNDLEAMKRAFASFAPFDAHSEVKEVATFVLTERGGKGFVRSGLELLMSRNI